jgi:predicted ATP-binding protein involved in virulence
MYQDIFEQKPDKSFVTILSGKRGSGKSTMLLELLTQGGLLDAYDLVVFVCPNFRFDKSIKMYLQDRENKCKFIVYEEYHPNIVETIFDNQNPDDDNTVLLVLDDCISQDKFRKNNSTDKLASVATVGRNRRISLLVTTQSLRSVHPDIRKNASFLLIFKCDHKGEMDSIYQDYGFGTLKEFCEWFQKKINKKHTALLLNQDAYDRKAFAKCVSLK